MIYKGYLITLKRPDKDTRWKQHWNTYIISKRVGVVWIAIDRAMSVTKAKWKIHELNKGVV